MFAGKRFEPQKRNYLVKLAWTGNNNKYDYYYLGKKLFIVSDYITLKQEGWQLMLRCSMVILASFPTCSPQYVQVDDGGILE